MRSTRGIFIGMVLAVMAMGLGGLAAAPRTVQSRRRGHSSHAARRLRAHAKTASGDPNPAADPVAAGRRDPFAPLLTLAGQSKQAKKVVRPPGKAGLMIGEIDVQGTVRGPRGAVAVVSSPDGHVYFLRPGDRLFDGTVARIDLNDVVFIEHAHDAFGRAFNRRVTLTVKPPEGAKP